MIGVVLWSDSHDRKAVFWCEDHGDLAYYDGSVETIFDQFTLAPGDMVEFNVILSGKVRRAGVPKLVANR